MKLKSSIIVILCCAQMALQAATYSVATTGSDTADGTEQAPWKTISKAAALVNPGDSILIAPGTYSETLKLNRDGTASSRINFKVTSGKAKVNAVIVKANFVTLDGFEVTGEWVNQWDGGIHVNPSVQNLWVVNSFLHDMTNQYGIFMDNAGVGPENGPQSCIISNNVFDLIGFPNLNIYGANTLVVSNLFSNSFGEGDAVRAWGAHHRIVSNTMTNIGGGKVGFDGHPDLIQTFGDWGVAAYDIVFEKNLAIGGKSQFCQLEQKGVADIRDWTFRNNVFIDIMYAANCDLPGTWFYNNLFYRCTRNTGHVIFFSDDYLGNKGVAWRSGAKNNIFLECGADPANSTFGWYCALPALTDLDCDYNYVGGTAFAPKDTDILRTVWDFVEDHGINGGDPGFVSIENLDFNLKAGSPLIGAGVALSGFTEDFTGTTRNGVWDIGPYAFQASENTETHMKLSASGSNFALQITGPVEGGYVLQKTSDFFQWQNIQTNSALGGSWIVQVPRGSESEFFRVQRQ